MSERTTHLKVVRAEIERRNGINEGQQVVVSDVNQLWDGLIMDENQELDGFFKRNYTGVAVNDSMRRASNSTSSGSSVSVSNRLDWNRAELDVACHSIKGRGKVKKLEKPKTKSQPR